jgi:3-phenylpropionate/trans-cinnamate dioxygenase ferredoxin reductase subunit
MNHLHVKYLLVGGGLAASAAARAIREADRDGAMLMVAQEIIRPYHREPLSKAYLRREVARETLFAEPPDWFERHHVELRTGRRAAHLDTGRHVVTLDSGEEISYDKLLIATGISARPLDVPGAKLPGLHYLRTFADADVLHHAIDQAKAEGRRHARGRGRAVVIGAGYLGVEVAASLTQLGLDVELAAEHAWPWDTFAGEATGKFLALYLQKQGVTVHVNAPAQRLEGDGRVQRAVLATGRVIDCDFAVAAVGLVVNKDLLRNTPVGVGKAILADEYCRTSVPDVYAAGDCCAVFDPLFGKHRLVDHAGHALVTGALAGRNMAGQVVSFSGASHFDSQAFGLRLDGWGEARLVDRRLLRGTPKLDGEAPDFVEIGVAADGRVAQVLAVGHRGEDDPLRELVARRVQVNGREDALRDPAVPLGEFLSS